jgi:hypothetical protein
MTTLLFTIVLEATDITSMLKANKVDDLLIGPNAEVNRPRDEEIWATSECSVR